MKKILTILLCLLAFEAVAAAPSVTCTPSRTSGTAPLSVFLDCTATTGGTNTYRNLHYRHVTTGQTGSFTTGAYAVKKGYSEGALAAFVFDASGAITSTVCNSLNECASTTNTITVTAADTTFSTNTMCVANGSLPVAGAGGCPSGATPRQGSGDFDADLAAAFGANGCGTGVPCKRVLFKRGDSFTASATTNMGASATVEIADYGTGALPVVNVASVVPITFNGTASDARIRNLEIVGEGAAATGNCILFTEATTNVLLSGLTCRDVGSGFVIQADTNTATGLAAVGNTIRDYYAASGGNGMFIYGASVALLGNTVGPSGAGAEHGVRFQHIRKAVVSNNTLGPMNGTARASLLIRANDYSTDADLSDFVLVSGNKLIGSSDGVILASSRPTNDTDDERIYDILVEKNWFVAGAGIQDAWLITSSRNTIRNNIFDLSGAASLNAVRIVNDNTSGTLPAPDDNLLANNTVYTTNSGTTFNAFNLGPGAGSVTGTTVINNICYGPNITTSPSCILDSATGTTQTTNTTDDPPAQTVTVNPFLTTPSASNLTTFQPSTAYADDGGTAAFPATKSDFFNCWDKTGANRIGAVVPRASAICRGAP